MAARNRDAQLGGQLVDIAVPVRILGERPDPDRPGWLIADLRDQPIVPRSSPPFEVDIEVRQAQCLIDRRRIDGAAPEGSLVQHLAHERQIAVDERNNRPGSHATESANPTRACSACLGRCDLAP